MLSDVEEGDNLMLTKLTPVATLVLTYLQPVLTAKRAAYKFCIGKVTSNISKIE